jgi:hypothetical protein
MEGEDRDDGTGGKKGPGGDHGLTFAVERPRHCTSDIGVGRDGTRIASRSRRLLTGSGDCFKREHRLSLDTLWVLH